MTASLVFPAPSAHPLDIRGELAGGGWFFSAGGTIEDTDLETLGFDGVEGQPEFRGGLVWNGRHHTEVSYLRIRREERGTVSGVVLGLIRFEDDVSLDLAVDYVRLHYGYSLISNPVIDLRPFLEIAVLKEETDIVNESTGDTARSDETAVFPLPGLDVVLAPTFPIRPRGRFSGIGTGDGHLIDVEGGVEGVLGPLFAGVGYRHADYLLEDDAREIADVDLDGFYVEGGVRF